MEDLWHKIGAVIAALISIIGGFYVRDRNAINKRLSKVENDLAQNKMDIKVIETKFIELKEDTSEIKESQKDIINLLTRRKS
jgi:hypothetical protein